MSSSSPEPRHTRQHHRLPAPATPAVSGGDARGDLPLDALSEILVRLPGKQLCRLRVVCRAWRCLLSAPWFAASHAARRPEPYVVASYADDVGLDRDSLVDVLDMSSGQIVWHVAAASNASDVVVSSSSSGGGGGGLVCCCVVKTVESGGFRLLDPVTGAVHQLPGDLAREHAARGFTLRDYGEPVHMFGQVAGEHKVLRMLPYRRRRGGGGGGGDDLFEVCTLSGGARWRGVQGPPRCFVWNEWTRVVVGGVVYCLSVAAYFAAVVNRRADDEQGWIVGFDLEAEEWRPSIKGPRGLVNGGGRPN